MSYNWVFPALSDRLVLGYCNRKIMNLEAYFDFLSPTDIRIKGHRIGIETVIHRFLDGYSPEEIRSEYPGLSLEKIYATITFYLSKKMLLMTI